MSPPSFVYLTLLTHKVLKETWIAEIWLPRRKKGKNKTIQNQTQICLESNIQSWPRRTRSKMAKSRISSNKTKRKLKIKHCQTLQTDIFDVWFVYEQKDEKRAKRRIWRFRVWSTIAFQKKVILLLYKPCYWIT